MSKHMCPIQLLMLIYHLHLTRAWLGAAPRMNTPKHVFQRNWTPCSKYGNHSRLKSQLDSDGGKGDLYDHLMSMNTFILIIKWYSHELHKSQGKWLNLYLELLTISYWSRVSYLTRSGLVGKRKHLKPIYSPYQLPWLAETIYCLLPCLRVEWQAMTLYAHLHKYRRGLPISTKNT